MFSTENKFRKIIRTIIDIFNAVLGIGAVVFAVMAFIDTAGNRWMFPVIFVMGGAMNLLTGIKYFMTDKRNAGIITIAAAAILVVISIMSYIAIGGR